jgi:propionyl-CoA carboxylase beta chain
MNELTDEYTKRFSNPYLAAEKGYIDEVIVPDQARKKLIKGFKMLENKVVNMPRKKHGNIPL